MRPSILTDTTARVWLALVSWALVATALVVTLPATPEQAAAIALIVLAAGVGLRAGGLGLPALGRLLVACGPTTDAVPAPASRIPDPVRHPVRPRAPGRC